MKAWSHGAAAQHKETQIHSRRMTLPVKPNYILVLVITDTEHRSWFVVSVHQKVGHTGRMKGRRVATSQHVDCLRGVTSSLQVFKFHTRRKPRAFTSTPLRLPLDTPQEVNAQTERWSSSCLGCCPSRPLWEIGPWPSAPGRTRTPSPGTQLGGDERHDHGPRVWVPNLEEDTKPMWQPGGGGVDWGRTWKETPHNPRTPLQSDTLLAGNDNNKTWTSSARASASRWDRWRLSDTTRPPLSVVAAADKGRKRVLCCAGRSTRLHLQAVFVLRDRPKRSGLPGGCILMLLSEAANSWEQLTFHYL